MMEGTATVNARSRGRMAAAAGALARVAAAAAFVAAFLLLAALLAVSALPFFGYRATMVQGGSMAPALKTGTLAISRATDPARLAVGDIIKFKRDGASAAVTHRIVAIRTVEGRLSFTTKGDANEAPDPNEIGFSADVQKVVLDVPYAGYAFGVARSPQGMLLLVGLPAIGLATLWVMGWGGGRKSPGTARA